ncbi:MAG: hypothetical protein WCG83_06730 [Candidatus Peregrinibacteria bacterium]
MLQRISTSNLTIATFALLLVATLSVQIGINHSASLPPVKAQIDGLPEYEHPESSAPTSESSESLASSYSSISSSFSFSSFQNSSEIVNNCVGSTCLNSDPSPACCVQDISAKTYINPMISAAGCSELEVQEQSLQYRILHTSDQPMTFLHARWMSGTEIRNGSCSENIIKEWKNNVNFCGNGIATELNKECDDGDKPGGNSYAPDSRCRPDCTLARCGDGIIDPARGEMCDDGPLNGLPGQSCAARCSIVMLQQLMNDIIPDAPIYMMYDFKPMETSDSALFIMTKPLYNWNSIWYPFTILSPLFDTPEARI